MGMSTHVVGFKPANAKWLNMKAIWDACQEAEIAVPDEVGDFFRRDGALGGHLEFGVCVADRLDEERFLRGPGNDRPPLVPSPHPATSRIEGQAPFDLVVVGMASEAARLEHREDGVGEELLVGRGGCRELRRTDGDADEEAQRERQSGPHQTSVRGPFSHHSPPGGGTASLAK